MPFRKRKSSDFQSEIESHVRIETDRLIAEGMSPRDAEAAARRTFGNLTLAQERFYESNHWLWLDQLRQDFHFGLRSLLKSPAFTAAAALTIALGIGANTAVFSLMDAVLLQALPVHNPKELVFLEAAGSAGPSGAPPYPCLERMRAETTSFAGLSAISNNDELRIEIDGRPEQAMSQIVSGNYFENLDVKPALGRLIGPGDEKLDPPVAVISDSYWQRRFNRDPSVIGRTLSHNQRTFTIVGVAPPEFWGVEPGSRVEITLPITIARGLMKDPNAWGFHAIARLKPDRSSTQAQAESDAVFQSFMSDSTLPADMIRKHFHHMELRPAAQGMDGLRRRFSKPLFVLMGIVGLVLLMATTNIANLLLARGMARQREFAIRLATGAGRARLVRQLLTETLLLFALGAIPGVILASRGVNVIEALFAQGRRAIMLDTNLNWRVLAFTILVTLVAGILAGLFPAWRAFRIDPDRAIREGQARTGESRRSASLARALVAFQVALSLILLVGAVTFVRTLSNLRSVDPGFQNAQVLTMSVELPEGYLQSGKSIGFWTRTLEAVRNIPGVRSAGLSTFTPLSGRDRGGMVRIRGYEPATSEDSIMRINQVSEGYFETLGIQLMRGRLLSAADTADAPRAALINEAAARKFFSTRDPIGQTIEFSKRGNEDNIYVIAGIVRDTKHRNLREPAPPFVFLPYQQPKDKERRVTLIVASTVPEAESNLLQPIRSALAEIDPRVLVSEVITIRSQLDATLLTERLLSGLSSAFGVLALILASIGLYGVLSYRIGQQRQSIGLRMVLGASPSSVAFNVLRQSGLVVIAGILAGLPVAFLIARTADSMLWGLEASDPTIYAAAAVLLCLVAFISAAVPARRASIIEPAEALRHD